MLINIEKGWTEVTINSDCEFNDFYAIADVLETVLKITFNQKLNDFSSTIYCDFEYKGSKLVIHYNIHLGVSIFPEALKNATVNDNDMVIEISTLLIKELTDITGT
jgi:hypothetical protein